MVFLEERSAERSVEAVGAHASASADALRAVLPRSAAGASDDQLLGAVAAVAELGRVQQAALSVLASEVAFRSVKMEGSETLATRNGQRDAAGLLQFIGRMSRSMAKRALEVGDAVAVRNAPSGAPLAPRWEHIAEAVLAGDVDAEAVAPVVAALEEVRHRADPTLLDAAEEGMMRIAAQSSPERTREQLRVWREALDPDGSRPREEAQRQARYFRVGREGRDGMTPIRGLLTPDAAATLNAALSTHTNPRATVAFSGDDGSNEAGVGRRELDPRSREQKLHDVLDGLVTAGHRATTTGRNGSRRTKTDVILTVTLDDLREGRGIGWVNGMNEPVGPVTAERIMCDEGFRTLVLGDEGEALWLGTKQRVFTPQQKLAIAARDETCAWVDCDAPADWCEVHHVTYYRDGGPTDIDNGILLCSAHHHMLHAQNWSIQMCEGVPYLYPPAFLNRTGEPIRLGGNRANAARRRRFRRQQQRLQQDSAALRSTGHGNRAVTETSASPTVTERQPPARHDPSNEKWPRAG